MSEPVVVVVNESESESEHEEEPIETDDSAVRIDQLVATVARVEALVLVLSERIGEMALHVDRANMVATDASNLASVAARHADAIEEVVEEIIEEQTGTPAEIPDVLPPENDGENDETPKSLTHRWYK